MSEAPPEAGQQSQLDSVHSAMRLRLVNTVIAAAAAAWAQLYTDRQHAIRQIVSLVASGQAHTVGLVEAYMAVKQLEATGTTSSSVTLDPAAYTTEKLRGIAADIVYGRPFGAYGAFISDGSQVTDAVKAAQSSVEKLAATDLQLAQTNAARDWMQATLANQGEGDLRIVGYRRVLTGATSCPLCTLASTRTYRIADLMPIHEHCDCGVEPLWGTEPVASVGTTVRVENDPEIGPRLMADHWSSVGPRLIY